MKNRKTVSSTEIKLIIVLNIQIRCTSYKVLILQGRKNINGKDVRNTRVHKIRSSSIQEYKIQMAMIMHLVHESTATSVGSTVLKAVGNYGIHPQESDWHWPLIYTCRWNMVSSVYIILTGTHV